MENVKGNPDSYREENGTPAVITERFYKAVLGNSKTFFYMRGDFRSSININFDKDKKITGVDMDGLTGEGALFNWGKFHIQQSKGNSTREEYERAYNAAMAFLAGYKQLSAPLPL